ncbi:IS200/IS605 family transposase [Clostridium perfringens]|uniref:IS200/IS605 family transposase n=1 Tax=Clostridium perfringens TaxID=1502 RepID=UPI00311A9CA4
MDTNSLAHTKWNCKYHIVFAPKHRRKEIYGEKKQEIGKILRQLCEWKGVKIVEAHACVDHVHMFVEIPPKMSVSSFVGFLKGKSSNALDYNISCLTLSLFFSLYIFIYRNPNRRFY